MKNILAYFPDEKTIEVWDVMYQLEENLEGKENPFKVREVIEFMDDNELYDGSGKEWFLEEERYFELIPE